MRPSQNHFATYTKSLGIIGADENVSERLRSHADNILNRTAINSFTEAFEEYVNRKTSSDAKRKTTSTILKVVKDGASGAEEIASSSSPGHNNKHLDTRLELGNFRSATNVDGAHATLKKRPAQDEAGIQQGSLEGRELRSAHDPVKVSQSAPQSPRKKASRSIIKNPAKKKSQKIKTIDAKLKITEPWNTLMECAIYMHSEWDVDLPTEAQIDMDTIGSMSRQMLFKIALRNLRWAQELSTYEGFDKFKCLPFKDAFTAMSGIWNLYSQDANNQFGEELTSQAKDICKMPWLEEHPTQISDIVTSLKADSNGTAKGLLDLTYELQKHQLPDSAAMRFITMMQKIGETGSSSTVISKSALAEVYGIGKEARKCDCLLTVDGLEICNFEAKRKGTNATDVAIQLRKNSKIAKSIALELEHLGIGCPPILNIHGNTALVSKLEKYGDDIYVIGKCASTIVLPELETDLDLFLDHGVYVLWNLMTHLDDYARDVFKKKREYEYKQRSEVGEAIVMAESKPWAEYLEWQRVVFHTPTKPQTKPTHSDLYISLLACKDDEA
ncbi:hypothetical protein BGZ79_009189 [Entomortierella chlamydospora]|nr:hypothetical protein BGZ79_009189 [Entomortierella chlamydospora]